MSDHKIKVSIVSYLNSLPFLHGLQNGGLTNEMELSQDVPAECANKLISGQVDIGLVPVAILPELPEYHFVSDYGICCDGPVSSVILASDVPLHEITEILLDYQSRTSVLLAQVLAEKKWRIRPIWKEASPGYETTIKGNTAGIIIGDRAFDAKKRHKFIYDLGAEWKELTGFPFVFATWISNKAIPEGFIQRFNTALEKGVQSIPEITRGLSRPFAGEPEIREYLQKNIRYDFREPQLQGLSLFLAYVNELLERNLMKII